MLDHVKPTLQEVNLDQIIFQTGTKDLRTEKTKSQIAKTTTDLATSLKNNGNTVTVLDIATRLDKLNKTN